MRSLQKILLITFMLSCGTEINLLKDVKTDITNDETPVKMVKFAKHELHELADSEKLLMPTDIAEGQTFVTEFKLEGDHKVTLVSKISPTETMIYTNGGYSFKYTEKVEGEVSEKDNTLEKFVAKTVEEPAAGEECKTTNICQCKKVAINKRYVTANKKYRVWVTTEDKDDSKKKTWILMQCDIYNGVTSAGEVRVPPEDFETKEPLLLYLNPKKSSSQLAEAVIYSNRQLFVWSNHVKSGPEKDKRGVRLVKKDTEGDSAPKELLAGADARENNGLLGGMTSTAEGITVWLKNDRGAIVYVFQGNKERKNKNDEEVIVPSFDVRGTLELDVAIKGKDQTKDQSKIDKFAIWLPSNKTESKLPNEIKGKVVGVSNKDKKLLVAEAEKGAIVDEKEEDDEG